MMEEDCIVFNEQVVTDRLTDFLRFTETSLTYEQAEEIAKKIKEKLMDNEEDALGMWGIALKPIIFISDIV